MIGIPLEDNYEATITQALAGSAGALTIYVSKTPVCTIPAGQEVVLTINPGKGMAYQENVLMESYDATAKTITIKTGGRAQKRYNGDTPTALSHAVGSKIIMSDPYPVWNSLDDYVSAAGDTMTGQLNFSGTDHAGVKMISLTTAERLALTPANGMIVYDTDLGELYHVIGGAWYVFAAGSTQPNASETVAGKIELATAAERAAGTATGGTGAALVPTNDALVKTSSGTSDENKVPVLDATGKLATGFIPGDAEINALQSKFTLGEGASADDVLSQTATGSVVQADGDEVDEYARIVGVLQETGLSAESKPVITPYPVVTLGSNFPAYVFQNYSTRLGDSMGVSGSAVTKIHQTFTVPDDLVSLGGLKIWLKKYGAPTGDISATLYATSAGAPTGSALATSTNTVAAGDLTTSYTEQTFTFTPYTLTVGAVYAVGIEFTGGDGSNYIQASLRYGGGTAEGTYYSYAAPTWTDRSADLAISLISGKAYLGGAAFLGTTPGEITNRPPSDSYATPSVAYTTSLGPIIGEKKFLFSPKKTVYATYTFSPASSETVNTTITIGGRAKRITCMLEQGADSKGGSLGFWEDNVHQFCLGFYQDSASDWLTYNSSSAIARGSRYSGASYAKTILNLISVGENSFTIQRSCTISGYTLAHVVHLIIELY